MELTEAEKEVLNRRVDRIFHQKTMQEIAQRISYLHEFVDKTGCEAFLAGLWWVGGGFFYLEEYFFGICSCLAGTAVNFYGYWLVIRSLLSYVSDFECNWCGAIFTIALGLVFQLAMSTLAAIRANKKREYALAEIELLKVRSREIANVH